MIIKMHTATDREASCVFCGASMPVRAGDLGLCDESTESPVCLGCGERGQPFLVGLLRLAHVAELFSCERSGEWNDGNALAALTQTARTFGVLMLDPSPVWASSSEAVH